MIVINVVKKVAVKIQMKYDEYDEINEWYYGVNDNKKEEFEELVLNIIQKYEKSKRIKLIDEEIERKQKWDKYVNNIIYNILKFSIIYCFVSYIFMFYNILNDINTNKNTTNNLDIVIDNLSIYRYYRKYM